MSVSRTAGKDVDGGKLGIPGDTDFAAIVSRSSLDGTAKNTRLSVGKDGVMQYVDYDVGNIPSEARVVGLRELYNLVKSDADRSMVRRHLLCQLALMRGKTESYSSTKQAETRSSTRRSAVFQAIKSASTGRSFRRRGMLTKLAWSDGGSSTSDTLGMVVDAVGGAGAAYAGQTLVNSLIPLSSVSGPASSVENAKSLLDGARVNGKHSISDWLRANGIAWTPSNPIRGPVAVPKAVFEKMNPLFRAAVGSPSLGLSAVKGVDRDVLKGIAAHEIGHLTMGKTRALTRHAHLPSILSGLISSMRLSSGDRSDAEALALTGANALVHSPTIAEEIIASVKGSKMLGLKGAKRLHAFRGIPSYLFSALSPLAVHYGRKATHAIRKSRD